MPRVFALEFLLELRVGIGPKRAQASCDLYGTMAGGKNVQGERVAAHRNFNIVIDAVEILYSCGEKRFGTCGVSNLGMAPAGQFEPGRSVLVHDVLFGRSKQ